MDRQQLGIPDPLQEFNETPEPPPVRAPNRRERRSMDRSARRASRHWIAGLRAKGKTDEEIHALLDYAQTLPELVQTPR